MVLHQSCFINYSIPPVCTTGIGRSTRIVPDRRKAIIRITSIEHFFIFSRTGNIRFGHGLETNRRIPIDAGFTSLTFLCSNQNNTVCTTCTIDRCRGSIFQYINGFDICHWDVVNAAYRESIYYIKRFIGLCDGTSTAYTYRDCSTRRPSCEITFTPGSRPCNAWATLDTGLQLLVRLLLKRWHQLGHDVSQYHNQLLRLRPMLVYLLSI